MKNYRSVSKWALALMCLLVTAGLVSPLSAGTVNPHTEIVLDTVTLNTGVTLQYAERGDGNGKAIIFLHGYTDSWFSYSEVLAKLPPQYHGYARHRSFDKGIKQFGAVPDDTAVFLLRPRHETRDVNKADERDIE